MREMEWEQLRVYLETTGLTHEQIVEAVSKYQIPKARSKQVDLRRKQLELPLEGDETPQFPKPPGDQL